MSATSVVGNNSWLHHSYPVEPAGRGDQGGAGRSLEKICQKQGSRSTIRIPCNSAPVILPVSRGLSDFNGIDDCKSRNLHKMAFFSTDG
jgi:hypothetical protein